MQINLVKLLLCAVATFALTEVANAQLCRERALSSKRIAKCTTTQGKCTGISGTNCVADVECSNATSSCLHAIPTDRFSIYKTFYCDNLESSNLSQDINEVLGRICPDERASPEGSRGGTSSSESNAQVSFSTIAVGVAAAVATAYVLDAIFGSGKRSAVSPPDQGLRRGRYGEDFRFDTPDGRMAKVCILPAFLGEPQTITYRWDAPNEQAREAEIRPNRTIDFVQFAHPSATGLFVRVTKPAAEHQPSDVYRLQAHRIGTTGCDVREAFKIVYPEYGGKGRFVRDN